MLILIIVSYNRNNILDVTWIYWIIWPLIWWPVLTVGKFGNVFSVHCIYEKVIREFYDNIESLLLHSFYNDNDKSLSYIRVTFWYWFHLYFLIIKILVPITITELTRPGPSTSNHSISSRLLIKTADKRPCTGISSEYLQNLIFIEMIFQM